MNQGERKLDIKGYLVQLTHVDLGSSIEMR
jgi:hypothetical protein